MLIDESGLTRKRCLTRLSNTKEWCSPYRTSMSANSAEPRWMVLIWIFAMVSDRQMLTESAARLGRSEEGIIWIG